MLSLRSLALLSLFVSQASAFGLDPSLIQHSVATAAHHANFASLIHHSTPSIAGAAAASANPLDAVVGAAQHALDAYKNSLQANPLTTKMLTGATLCMTGDAIVQSREEGPYDVRRAASFGAFDMVYRAGQHAAFPWIIEHCRGQFFNAAVMAVAGSSFHATPDMTSNFAAMEQTLASQLGIVPFLYYPVFFGLTGFMQGLTVDGSLERAKEKFLPLMQRNLLFWIPVQFVQFGFIEENLQIPFLSVAGLGWTIILSAMAGSTKTYSEENNEMDVVINADEANVTMSETEKLLRDGRLGAAVVEASSRPEDFVMELPSSKGESYASTENVVYEQR